MAVMKKVKKAAQKEPVVKKKPAGKRLPARTPVKPRVTNKVTAQTGETLTPAKQKPEQVADSSLLHSTGRNSTAIQLSWHRYAFSLKAGAWRQYITGTAFKTSMAEALNACTSYRKETEQEKYGEELHFLYRSLEQLHIAGYYITEDTLHLIWDIADIDFVVPNRHHLPDRVMQPEKWEDRFLFMLNRFYNAVRQTLKSHIHYSRVATMEIEAHSHKQHVAPYDADLFTKRKMTDEYLAALLSGHTVNLPYNNLHLERLKERLHNAEFCSIIDYEGGIGPVIIKKEDKI